MAIFGEASSTAIAGFILTGVSFLIQFIGFVTPYWTYESKDDITTHKGLWLKCDGAKDITSTCKSISCDDDHACTGSLIIARFIASLSFGMLLAAVIIVALKVFVFKDKPIIRFTIVFCFIAGTCALIATISYGADADIEAEHLNFSFAFYIIAAAGSYLSGSLLVVGK